MGMTSVTRLVDGQIPEGATGDIVSNARGRPAYKSVGKLKQELSEKKENKNLPENQNILQNQSTPIENTGILMIKQNSMEHSNNSELAPKFFENELIFSNNTSSTQQQQQLQQQQVIST